MMLVRSPSTGFVLAMLLLLSGVPAGGAIYLRSDAAVTDAVRGAAIQVYGPRVYVIQPAADDAFQAAFPNVELFVLREPLTTWSPPHVMAWRAVDARAWDVTRDFNALMRDTGTLAVSDADAVRVAKAYAQVANAELKLGKSVVHAADAGWLGRAVTSPAALRRIDGWVVDLHTWSEENGVLARWTVTTTFAGVASAEWRVLDVGAGPARRDEHALFLPRDLRVVNDYAPGHALRVSRVADGVTTPLHAPEAFSSMSFSPVSVRGTLDGSEWRVYYPAAYPAPANLAALATALADAGVHAYDAQVERNVAGPCRDASNPAPNWGFESRDPDCVLEVFVIPPNVLACLACPLAGDDVRILVSALFVEELQGDLGGPHLYTNPEKHDLASISRLVVGHEHFHNLQYAINQWALRDPLFASPWDAVYEGQARLSEVLLDPEAAHDASSAWFFDMDLRHSHPQYDLCGSSYEAGLYWGHVYAREGGLETLRKALREVPAATGKCWSAFPAAMGRALPPGRTHAAVMHDLAVVDHRGDYAWADPLSGTSRAWGAPLLDPVAELSLQLGTRATDVHASGVRYVRMPADQPFRVACQGTSHGNSALAASVLRLGADGALIERVPVPCGALAPVPAAPRAVLEVRAVDAQLVQFTVRTEV